MAVIGLPVVHVLVVGELNGLGCALTNSLELTTSILVELAVGRVEHHLTLVDGNTGCIHSGLAIGAHDELASVAREELLATDLINQTSIARRGYERLQIHDEFIALVDLEAVKLEVGLRVVDVVTVAEVEDVHRGGTACGITFAGDCGCGLLIVDIVSIELYATSVDDNLLTRRDEL